MNKHGRPQGGGQNGHLPPWKLGLRIKISEKPEYSSFISINWFNGKGPNFLNYLK